MSDYQKTAAIILRAMDYKEADQLLTVYTKARGKITVLAKGVKKNTSKLRGGVQLFSQSELTLAVGKGLPVVIGADCQNGFAPIRSDFKRLSYAGYCAELLDQLLVGDEYDEAIFILLVQHLNLLSYIDPWIAAKMLEVRLLERMGYRLALSGCQHCQKPISAADEFYGTNGGLLCAQCKREGLAVTPLDTECVTLLRALGALPLALLDYIVPSARAKKRLDDYLDLQIDYILERPLKTRQFLRQMTAGA